MHSAAPSLVEPYYPYLVRENILSKEGKKATLNNIWQKVLAR
jgi:hypothetical protein